MNMAKTRQVIYPFAQRGWAPMNSGWWSRGEFWARYDATTDTYTLLKNGAVVVERPLDVETLDAYADRRKGGLSRKPGKPQTR